jgi:hypothetical protein
MRQLFAIVLIALVVSCTAAPNCSAVKGNNDGSNLYLPPQNCLESEPGLLKCGKGFEACVKAQGSTCASVEMCAKDYIACITFTPINTAGVNCSSWATSFNNFELYLAAGGIYNGSVLQKACIDVTCMAAKSAFDINVKNAQGDLCFVDPAKVCIPPSFEPITAAPNQASFTLTFGGNWEGIATALADKSSPAYKKIEAALQAGIAKIVQVEAYKIAIVTIFLASLKVEFLVNDPNITPADVKGKIDAAIASGTVAASFTELAALPGVPAIEVTGLAIADPNTPAPPTSASSVAAVLAFAMMVAAMLF